MLWRTVVIGGRRHSRIAPAVASLLVLFLTSSGCDALTAKGHASRQPFADPRIVSLVDSAESHDAARAQSYVRAGADVNAAGKDGVTPLIWAMSKNDIVAVELLLRLGADPNKAMNNGNSPIWLASGRDNVRMLEMLLRYRGDPNAMGEHQTTALEIAVRQLLPKNVDLLIKHGANINYADDTGDSAATWAVSIGHFELVAQLLKLGYSQNLRHLAASVQVRHVPEDSEEQKWKDRVIQMLRQRGVEYPITRHAK